MRSRNLILGTIVLAGLVALTGLETLGKKGGNKPPPTTADPAIAYVSNAGQVMVMDADGKNQTVVYENTSIDVWSPSWSPDGKHLAFEGGTDDGPHDLYRIDVDVVGGVPQGGDLTVLVNDTDVWWPEWSPNGDLIAFVAQPASEIRLVPATGGSQQLLYTTPAGREIQEVTWSPDASKVAFLETIVADGTGYLCVLDLATQAVTTVDVPHTEGHLSFYGISWARTGNEIAYTERVRKTVVRKKETTTKITRTLHIIELSTGNTTRVHGDSGMPCWSPDDSKLVHEHYGDGLRIFDLATGTCTDLHSSGTRPDWRR